MLMTGSSKTLTAWVPLAAPSMNSLLYCIRGRHEAKPEVRMFRSQFKSYLPLWTLASTGPFLVRFTFYESWYHKNGFPKKKDVHNLVKCCEDALMDRYGWDDSLIWAESYQKIHTQDKVGIEVTIQPYEGVSHVGNA